VAVEAFAVRCDEDRTLGPFADGQVDRSRRAWRERDGHDPAALAEHREGPMPALDAERFDVGTESFGDPQAVDGQQREDPNVPAAESGASPRMRASSCARRVAASISTPADARLAATGVRVGIVGRRPPRLP
jgi:hypothetical protein